LHARKECACGSPVLLRTYPSASAPIGCAIWEAARATTAAPTFFLPIKFRNRTGGEFVDGGIDCNNSTKVLIKEAKAYHRMKDYTATRPTCVISISMGQKDLIQLDKPASIFWFKDRIGLSIAPALAATSQTMRRSTMKYHSLQSRARRLISITGSTCPKECSI
jgi:patatin-like phospholipase/acyl hydrolase